MSLTRSLLEELEGQAPVTRRVLSRVPADGLGWRPHERAMSAGQLALHTASIPGRTAELILEVEYVGDRPASEGAGGPEPGSIPTPDGVDEVLETFDAGVVRHVLLNHLYHHRGQLCTYLRLLDREVPAVFGASADESAF